MAPTPKLARAALVFTIVVGVCVGCEETMTGPTATPTPSAATPTPAPARVVYVGRGDQGQLVNAFQDSVSGTSTSTIHVGESIQWAWVNGTHSTTSGTCSQGCVPNGLWNSGIGIALTYQHNFPEAGTFPYFCLVHGTMMQGTVVVE